MGAIRKAPGKDMHRVSNTQKAVSMPRNKTLCFGVGRCPEHFQDSAWTFGKDEEAADPGPRFNRPYGFTISSASASTS